MTSKGGYTLSSIPLVLGKILYQITGPLRTHLTLPRTSSLQILERTLVGLLRTAMGNPPMPHQEFPSDSSPPFPPMEEDSVFRSTSLQEGRNSRYSREIFLYSFGINDENFNGCHGSSGTPPERPLRMSSECTYDVLMSILSLMPN